MPQAAQTPQAVGQTRAGRGGGTHRRDLRRPKGPKVSVLASSSFHLHGQLSDPLHGAIQFRLHRIALALLERGVDPADRFLTPLLEPEDLYAQLARQKLHRLVSAERPHAAPPSIAGQVPAGLPAKPGLGKTWTSQARPHLPPAHQQSTFFSKLSVMFRSSLDTSIKPILCPRKSGPTQKERRICKHAVPYCANTTWQPSSIARFGCQPRCRSNSSLSAPCINLTTCASSPPIVSRTCAGIADRFVASRSSPMPPPDWPLPARCILE